MAQPTLLPDGIKRLTAFSAIVNTSTAFTASQDTSNDHRIFNCLGSAGLPLGKEANFHHLIQGIWSPILPGKTIISREQLIKQRLARPLQLQYPELISHLTPDWIKGIEKFAFAPAPKQQASLAEWGPPAMFICQQTPTSQQCSNPPHSCGPRGSQTWRPPNGHNPI